MYDILKFKNDIDDDYFVVKKVKKTISDFYKNDGKDNGVCVIEARNFSFASPRLTGSINSNEKYGKKWVNRDNLMKIIPLFCASRDKFSETGKYKDISDYRVVDTIYKTSDGGVKYQKDSEFLQDCLLFTLCTQYNDCKQNSIFWETADCLLDKKRKSTKIYNLYWFLSNETKLKGLKNIEKYNKNEFGKLWKEHHLYPKIAELKGLLEDFAFNQIRPKLLEYELLK